MVGLAPALWHPLQPVRLLCCVQGIAACQLHTADAPGQSSVHPLPSTACCTAGKSERKRRTRRVLRSSRQSSLKAGEAAEPPVPGLASQRSALGRQESSRSAASQLSARGPPSARQPLAAADSPRLSARESARGGPPAQPAVPEPQPEQEAAEPEAFEEEDQPAQEPSVEDAEQEEPEQDELEQAGAEAEAEAEQQADVELDSPPADEVAEEQEEVPAAPTHRKVYVPSETIDEVLDSMGVPSYDHFFEPAPPQAVRCNSGQGAWGDYSAVRLAPLQRARALLAAYKHAAKGLL